MSQSTRRGFLAVAGAAGAASVAFAAAPSAGAAKPAHNAAPKQLPDGAKGAMAAFVDDVRTGEITVMVEGREVVVHDKELVARLAHAVAGAARSTDSTTA